MEKAPIKKQKKPSWTKTEKSNESLRKLFGLHLAATKAPSERKVRRAFCEGLKKVGFFKDLKLEALNWLQYDPQNPLVYSYLFEACQELQDPYCSARAAMSLVEVNPSNSSYWNLAGYLLLKVNENKRAEQAFRQAIIVNPDRHNNYRGLALTLWAQGHHREAAKILIDQLCKVHNRRYGAVNSIFRQEIGYILRSWKLATDIDGNAEILNIALENKIPLEDKEALRITLHWETDNCDVSLSVSPPSGGTLTTNNPCWRGLGPEYVTVPLSQIEDGEYHIGLDYDENAMGLVRPIVVILRPVVSPLPNMEIHTTTLLPGEHGTKLLTTINQED